MREIINEEVITDIWATTPLPLVKNLDAVEVTVFSKAVTRPPYKLLAFERVDDPLGTGTKVLTFDPFLPPFARFPVFGHLFTKLKKNPEETAVVRTFCGEKLGFAMKQAINLDASVAKRIHIQPVFFYTDTPSAGYQFEYHPATIIKWVKVFYQRGYTIVKPILVTNDVMFFEAEVDPQVISDLIALGVYSGDNFLKDNINILSLAQFRQGLVYEETK